MLQKNGDVLAQYRRWFRYILVDEYQDTNTAQYLWLRLLARPEDGPANICCVGDDDQSIYGWRGAEVGNILRFEKDFPGAEVIRLEQNYRSTKHILGAAAGVISANKARLGKTLWTEADEGDKVRLIGHWDGEEEARWVGEEIEALQTGTRGRAPTPLDGIAVLVRASHQMRAFEDRFLSIGLPYRVIGGPRFYERAEIRDALAYFRVVAQPDDGLAFERIVNTPRRGIGDKALREIQLVSREQQLPMLEAARILADRGALKGKAGKSLGKLVADFDRWRMWLLSDSIAMTHVELAEQILEESGYTDMWRADKSPDAPGRLDNLKELIRFLGEFDNLVGFLEHVSLVMENNETGDGEKVSIMTLHAAKGLEFPAVFLPGWEEGLFPSQRAMDESGVKGLEEERRLAYVGVTRARELCSISFAANRRLYNQWQSSLPSRFIDELPESHVEVLTPPGLYGGAYGVAANPGMTASRGSALERRASEASAYNSPGWKRLQANAGRRGVVSPESRRHAQDAVTLPEFEIGQRVFHQKFGYGAVTGIDMDNVDVAFEKAGAKKVKAGYLTTADDVPF